MGTWELGVQSTAFKYPPCPFYIGAVFSFCSGACFTKHSRELEPTLSVFPCHHFPATHTANEKTDSDVSVGGPCRAETEMGPRRSRGEATPLSHPPTSGQSLPALTLSNSKL